MNRFITFVLVMIVLAAACSPSTVTPIPVTAIPPVTDTSGPVITVTPVSQDAQFLPNPNLTPGSFNPDVTQATIGSTICVPGWTSTVRPPVSYTDNLKIQQIAQYGYQDTSTADYEEDHFIPLDLGGNPTDPNNLWPQPRLTTPYNAAKKDTLEATIVRLVCNGTLSLADARSQMQTDWVQAYRQYVSPNLGVLPMTPAPEDP